MGNLALPIWMALCFVLGVDVHRYNENCESMGGDMNLEAEHVVCLLIVTVGLLLGGLIYSMHDIENKALEQCEQCRSNKAEIAKQKFLIRHGYEP